MTRKPKTPRLDRLKRFAEVFAIAGLIQGALNGICFALQIPVTFSFYEIALVWLFCN
jgi:hypothetical protein